MTTRRGLSIAAAALVAFLALSPQAFAKPAFKKVTEVRSPTSLTNAPGSKKVVFVTERRGLIRVIRRGKLLKRPFLDIRGRTVNDWVEQGLLGLAFSPDYRKTGKFYVHFTVKSGDVRIEEFRRNGKKPLIANPRSRRTVLNIPEVAADAGHNGGSLKFLGRYLYISVGDGGNPGDVRNQAQDTESLRGKVLRVDPRPDRGPASITGFQPVTRSPAGRARTPFSPTGCATPIPSVSTATVTGSATCWSPT